MKFTDRDAEIANYLDEGQTYAYIEAVLGVYPATIARVREKMRIIREDYNIQVLPTRWKHQDIRETISTDGDSELREIEREAELLKNKLRS
jgi:hypothetical protein